MSALTTGEMNDFTNSSPKEQWYDDPKVVDGIKKLLASLFDLIVLFLKRHNTAKKN